MSKIKLKPDWTRQLHNAIEARRNRPFNWKEQNCCVFAADLVEAMTGADLASEFRAALAKKATGRAQIQKVLADRGGLINLITEIVTAAGMRSVPVAFAKRGNVVIAIAENLAAGICLGAVSVFPGKDGLVFHPTSTAIQVFSL